MNTRAPPASPSPALRERVASEASRVRAGVAPPSPSHRSAMGPSLSRAAGEGLTRETVLVYRHRLAPASEVGFLKRFYVGFERLAPVWLGCHIEDGAGALTDNPLRLGRAGPIGAVERSLF